MKKLSVILLALAIAAFAVPAFAGEVAMDGEYTFGGEAYDGDESGEAGTFYDELDLNIEVKSGDVKFHWDVEIADDPKFDREDDEGGLNTDDDAPGKPNKLVDGFYVKWQATDALSLRIGEIGGPDGPNTLVTDGPLNGHGTVNLGYAVEDVADLGFYLTRVEEGGEDDITTMAVQVDGEIGPAEAGLLFIQTTDDLNDDAGYGIVEVYGSFSAGPVGVTLDFGSVSADADDSGDGGTVLLAEFNLEELVGFGLNIGLVQTNEDYTGSPYGDDFDRAKIYGDELPDSMMVFLGVEYGVNDALSVGLDAIVMNDVDSNDGPTEIDVWGAYSFADNVNVEFGYAMQTANDGEDAGYEDATLAWYEFVFGF